MQTEQYRQRYIQLGVPPSRCTVDGNIKLDYEAPRLDAVEQQRIKNSICRHQDCPVIVFGSLHPPEESVAANAMKQVWKSFPDAIAVIIPRHPEKTAAMQQTLSADGERVCLYSALPQAQPERLCIVDAFELSLKIYSIADIVVVGGTYNRKIGGHNITEPALFSKPVIYGPYIHKQAGLHDLLMPVFRRNLLR